jgi:hypothetical protein
MRDVMLIAGSYKELESIYMVRRLYVSDEEQSDEQINEIYKRFSKAYNLVKGNQELSVMLQEVHSYIDSLKEVGIEDKDVKTNIILTLILDS